MSGGYFTNRWVLSDIAEDIDKVVLMNKLPDEWGTVRDYPDEVIQKLITAADDLRRLSSRIYYIDYLLAGDIGPEQLLEKWEKIS